MIDDNMEKKTDAKNAKTDVEKRQNMQKTDIKKAKASLKK